ncbi:MAG: AAA family ATPase [Gemmatimonadales bacterium]
MNQPNTLNPFVLGGVVTGKRFAGRTAEIERLRVLAAEAQHVYLFAPRRYGKTSLLREAFSQAQQERKLSLVWCDCLPTADPQGLASRLAAEVARAARRGKVAEWAKTAGSLFKRLRPVLKVGPEGRMEITIDLSPPGQGSLPDLEDALAAVDRLADMKRRPVVLVFDEFQQIAEWDKGYQIEAILRTAIQQFERVACVFAGSERHLLQLMFSDRARPLFKLAAPFPLRRLSREELAPWLEERFRETGYQLQADATEALLSIGAGHPWATQYLGHFVWETAMAHGGRSVTAQVVNDGLTQALEAGDTIYATDYARLTSPQRQVLAAIGAEPTKSPTAAAYLRQHRLPSKSTVSQSVRSLSEKGYLEVQEGPYFVSDPVFGEWVRRQQSVFASVTIVTDG